MVAVTFDYQGDAPNCGFMAVEKYWNEEKHFRK
jgi:hypothetical protein